MPLPGVTPYPPEFAARYRARGYWDDRPLITHFLSVFTDHASRAAIVDDEGSYTYGDLAGAAAGAAPARARDVNFDELHRRVRADHPHLRLSILQGGYPEPAEGYVSLEELHQRQPTRHSAADLDRIVSKIDPDDPAVFQLSGGTTGVPKLIPRTHNDYAYNSRAAV